MNKTKLLIIALCVFINAFSSQGIPLAFAQEDDSQLYADYLNGDDETNEEGDEFGGFFDDPSLLGNDDTFFDSEPINEEDEQALAEQYMLEMMEMQSSLCREPNGSYKLDTVENPLGGEPIDCAAFTMLQYQLLEEEHSADLAFKCITRGKTPVESMSMLKDLGIPLERHFNCPGKSETWGECVDDLVCNTLKSSPIGLARKALELAGVPPMKCQTSTDSDCLTEAFWGIWKNLITNVDAVWELLKLGWNGVKWVGGKIVDGVSWVGEKLCFWCETTEIEDHTELSQHMIAQQEDGFFKKFMQSPGKATKELLGKLFGSFKRYIGEAISNNFGCAKWSSSRFNPLDGQEAYCEDPVISWDCASCGQKMNMACGVVGFVGGEILTSFVAGKALAYGAKMSQFTRANIVAAKVAKTKVAKGLGSGLKFTGTKIVGAFSFGARIGAGLVKSGGRWAIKMGGRLVPLSPAAKAKLVNILAKGGRYATAPFRAVGKGVKKYFELMENAFVLGYQGKNGLKALKTSRQINAIEKQLNAIKANLGQADDVTLAMVREQEAALKALKEYKTALREAIAAKGDKRTLISRMKEKLGEYWKRRRAADKHSIALRATSQSSDVARFTPSAMEKAEEMILIKEGVTKKFVEGTASRSELRKLFTANRERLWEASNIAGRSLSKKEKLAILRAHYTGTRNANGAYSVADLAAKTRILREAGLGNVTRGLMQANVTGTNTVARVLTNSEAAFVLSRAGETGTNALVLQKTQSLLKQDKIKYTGNGVFQFKNGNGNPALVLDPNKDAALIARLEGREAPKIAANAPKTFENSVMIQRRKELGTMAKGQGDEAIPYLEAISPSSRRVMNNPAFAGLKTTCGKLSIPMRSWRRTSVPVAKIKPGNFSYHGQIPDSATLNRHLRTSNGEYMGLSTLMNPNNNLAGGGGIRNVALCLAQGALVCVVGGAESELVLMDKNWSVCK